MLTSLYLSIVLPASMPSADLKVTVIVGPSLMKCSMAMPIAINAATIGTIQTAEMPLRRAGTTVASGMSSCGSAMASFPRSRCVPEQAGVERPGSEHGEHDDAHEQGHARTRLRLHQGAQLNERDDEGVDEHIEHRPAADEGDGAMHAGAQTRIARAAALHSNQKIAQHRELAHRDDHACDEDDQRERP